jgi:drug/metabolite transporter (DMT)-like permease
MHAKNLPALFAGLAAAAIWGGMYVVSKVVLEVVPPFALLAMRLILGFVSLALVIWWGKRAYPANFWQVFGVGIVGYGISLGFQFVGTKLSTASNGALVTSATPAFVLLFAPFLLGEKATPRRIFALIIATIGVIAVIDPRSAQLSSDLFLGNLSLLAAALTWALYSVLVRKVSRGGDVLTLSAVMLLGGLPVSIPAGTWEVLTLGMGDIFTPGIIGGILFLGVISTAIAMFLWNYAFAHLPAAVASLTFFAQPVVGTLLGWALLGEQITPLFLLGGVLIGLGLIVGGNE